MIARASEAGRSQGWGWGGGEEGLVVVGVEEVVGVVEEVEAAEGEGYSRRESVVGE